MASFVTWNVTEPTSAAAVALTETASGSELTAVSCSKPLPMRRSEASDRSALTSLRMPDSSVRACSSWERRLESATWGRRSISMSWLMMVEVSRPEERPSMNDIVIS